MFRRNFKVIHIYKQQRFASGTTRKIAYPNLSAAAYQPQNVEKNKYKDRKTEENYKAQLSSEQPTFSMVLPPPNVTGKLHLGHALACTVQDVIARRQRSLGYNVLWVPGTDHAGIATQTVVEKYLKTHKNTSRHDIGRANFLKEVWEWKEQHGGTICDQLKTLGCSLDWSREVFTMSARHTHAVNSAFITLFHRGLIYRKKALVNWCNALKSTVSDIEIENRIVNGPTDVKVYGYKDPVKFGLMYNLAYKVLDTDEEVIVATTMPETMLGDTAVAVHPDDTRYQHLIGKHVMHPFRHKSIPIITDNFVDMELGTGAVKITPAHSKVDYEIAKHHNLPLIQVVNEDGIMQNAGQYNNLSKYDCRNKLIKDIEDMGILKEVTPHQMMLPTCSRTGDVIEYLPKEQWFLSCSELNRKASELVERGKLKIEPEKYVKNWLNWIGDDRDWCISRQLWWGHQVPAYKCTLEDNVVWIAATDEITAKMEAAKYLRTMPELVKAERDSDVLDTWFSSGIYPFAALGWPETTEDLNKFYPLNLMVTGHDILGFWVHRMLILGLELTGKFPFNEVFLHGIITDSKGAKMSKSRGNVIDPVDVIEGISMEKLKKKSEDLHKSGILNKEELQKAKAYHKSNFTSTNGIPECGVDALRITLLSQDMKSNFVGFDVALCHANKLFGNKIWQSVKYTQMSFDKLKEINEEICEKDLTYFDKWILSRLSNLVELVNESMNEYNFYIATKAIKTLMYNEFCDIYLEATKSGFNSPDTKPGYCHAHTLSAVLNTSLRCLAPFMIYLTEELIPKVPAFEKNIIVNFDDASNKYLDFPQPTDFKKWKDPNLETQVSHLLSAVYLVRELKGLYNISNKFRPSILIKTTNDSLLRDIIENREAVLNLTRCDDVKFHMDPNKKYVSGVLDKETKIDVELVGPDAEKLIMAAKTKLKSRKEKLENSMEKLESKLLNDHYTASVPDWLQNLEKERLKTTKKELEELERLID